MIAAAFVVLMAAAGGDGAKPASFEVVIINDCTRDIKARFVVDPPSQDEGDKKLHDALAVKARKAPVVRLRAKSRSKRLMVAHEQLVVLHGSGGYMSAGFDSLEDGTGAEIRIDKSCRGISDTKGPAPRAP